MESSLDISSEYPRTEVYFDAGDGRPLAFEAATGISAGNTLTSWLYGLHFASVWGLWYRIFVCVTGVAVAALSVTGVWIWWRKRVKSRAFAPETANARVAGRILERVRDARSDPGATGGSSTGVSA